MWLDMKKHMWLCSLFPAITSLSLQPTSIQGRITGRASQGRQPIKGAKTSLE